jgi:uncharacterized protein
MKKFHLFVLLVTVVLGIVYTYLGFRLASSPMMWFVLSIPIVLIFSMPMMFWILEWDSPLWFSVPFQWGCFLSMGWVTYLFLFTLGRDLIVIPLLWAGVEFVSPAYRSVGNQFIFLASSVIVAIGMYRTYRTPRINLVNVPIKNLHSSLQGLRIAQISDLHVGLTIRRKFVEKVVSATNALNAHIIALTGDFADGSVSDLDSEIQPLSNLKAEIGVFYVPGNHEYYWDGEEWIEKMKALGARVLLNSNVKIDYADVRVLVGGVVDPAAAQLGKPRCVPDVSAAAQEQEPSEFKILLAHHPQFTLEAAKAGFDLQLSGHTHGGQFFPWTLVARRAHRFFLGLIQFENMWVYISPGTGTWGPPIRIGTTPEVTLLILKSAG